MHPTTKVKTFTVVFAALAILMLPCVAKIATASPDRNRAPASSPPPTYIYIGYEWSWWDGGTFDLHLDRGDQEFIATYGSASVVLVATEACSALGYVAVTCKVAVGLAAVWIASEVSGWNGACDDLIVYLSVWGTWKGSDCVRIANGWYA